MPAIGIDLGGTKIETQVFDSQWLMKRRRSRPTPKIYSDLMDALKSEIEWAQNFVEEPCQIGIAAPGYISQQTQNSVAANVAIDGQPFWSDLQNIAQSSITLVNDGDALAVSEANLGVAVGAEKVVAIVFGTGVGGGIVLRGRPVFAEEPYTREFGHLSIPSDVLGSEDLRALQCSCGGTGCFETYLSGPGVGRLATLKLGVERTARQLGELGLAHPESRLVWDIWGRLAAHLLGLVIDQQSPDKIVLGGGLSNIAGIAEFLSGHLAAQKEFSKNYPPILVSDGGATSGARGAAWLAVHQTDEGTY